MRRCQILAEQVSQINKDAQLDDYYGTENLMFLLIYGRRIKVL
jgi:hypothetical protein